MSLLLWQQVIRFRNRNQQLVRFHLSNCLNGQGVTTTSLSICEKHHSIKCPWNVSLEDCQFSKYVQLCKVSFTCLGSYFVVIISLCCYINLSKWCQRVSFLFPGTLKIYRAVVGHTTTSWYYLTL